MLQLTSNLASVIIKRSPLHVSLCSHWTPSAQTQKSHFVSRGSEMRLCLGMSVYVCFSCVSDRSVSPACESPQAERMCVIAHSVSISAPPPLLKLFVCFYPGWTNVNISEAPKWCLTACLTAWLFLAVFIHMKKYLLSWQVSLFQDWTKSPCSCFILVLSHFSIPLFLFCFFFSSDLSCSFLILDPFWSPCVTAPGAVIPDMIKTHAHIGLAFTGEL